MKAVIIGGTTPAMQAALYLRALGYEVKIVVSSTYLGEDFTGTRRYDPVDQQFKGKQVVNARMGKLLFPENEPLLNGSMKKQFLLRMDEANVSVLFMTRAAGVKTQNGRITHVSLADKLGVYDEACDLLIDGTLYHELSSFLSGQPVRIKAGTSARLMLTYFGMNTLPEFPQNPGIRCVRGAASHDHAYLISENLFTQDTSLEDARKLLLKNAVQAAMDIRNDPSCQGAYLAGSVSPMIDAEIPASSVKSHANLLLPDDILNGTFEHTDIFPKSPLIQKLSCDILVVGGGTAGIRAALASARMHTKVCLAEFFTTIGGTRTTGGIQPPYDGNRNKLFLAMWKEIRSFAEKTGGIKDGRTAAACEALLYETRLSETDIALIRPAVAFSVKKEGRRIKSVLFASPDSLCEVEATNIIDATGDADIAVFAGLPTQYGDDALSATQNYSQTHVSSGTVYDVPMADQDVINLTDRSEWQRAIRLNTFKSAPYDIYEMLTVRESRRIEGRKTIRLRDIYRGRRHKDTIYTCMSDYDTHSRCFSAIGRFAVLPSHAPIKFPSVPYGALLPKETDNLLVCAKAISADQEAAAHMRMSPDIMCIGHIAGIIAAQSAKQNTPLPAFDLTPVQNEMYALGAIIKKPGSEDEYEITAQMLAARLASGDESAFAEALICSWETLPDLLGEIRACGADTKPLLTAMTLLYYGDVSCAQEVAQALDTLNNAYGVQSRKDVYTNKIIMGGDTTGRDPYFRIITLTMLLAKNGLREYVPLIESVMNNTCIGKEFMLPSPERPILRPDMHVHGNFDRMLSLASAAILMPDTRFSKPLMRMYRLQTENPNRAPVFHNTWLELKLLEAAYLCGHPDAKTLLQDFCRNPYFIIRKSALGILSKPNEE